MPPITFPGISDVVLNAAGRVLLETSGLSGYEFQPVRKATIVELHWEEWDLTAGDPAELPESGEPEDYILDRLHDPDIARQMGDIWELVVPVGALIWRPAKMTASHREFHIERSSWNGADLFRGDGYNAVFASDQAKLWFEEHLVQYVQFEEFNWQ